MKIWLIVVVIHTTWAVGKLKPEKKFTPERDSNPWPLRDTGAVLYQLSYHAIWELVTLWVHNIQ